MTFFRSRHLPLVAFCALAPIFAASATAQVPEGTAVVGTFSGPISSGTSGLFLVPLAGGAMTPVSGLPAQLQQTGGGSFQQGVSSVGLRSSDGAIVVGTVGAASGPWQGAIELFLVYLNGSTVDPARTQQILLGNTSGVSGALVLPLPDDRILVTASDGAGAFTAGPMANHLFAIVDLSGPTPGFTLLPTPAGSGVGGGFTVDPTGQFLYYLLTTNIGSASRVAHLHRWDMVANVACEIASWPGQLAKGLCCDDDGTVYISADDLTAVAHYVHTVHPDGCNPAASTSQQSSLPLAVSGLAQDRASGRFVMATGGYAPGFPTTNFNSLALIDPTSGAATVIASPPAGGWGLMSGVAVNNTIESYGAPSDGQNHSWFENFPNPGGQPNLGNGGFSLTLRTTPTLPLMSALVVAFGRGSNTVLGVEILVDLGTAIVITVPTGLSVPYAMPVPNSPALQGGVVTAQSVHLETGGSLSASAGLTFTVQ